MKLPITVFIVLPAVFAVLAFCSGCKVIEAEALAASQQATITKDTMVPKIGGVPIPIEPTTGQEVVFTGGNVGVIVLPGVLDLGLVGGFVKGKQVEAPQPVRFGGGK